MMLLADANLNGHVERLVKRMQGEPWVEFWSFLQLTHVTFAEAGLDPADSDAVVWHRCQEKDLFLITNNRNSEGPDSLEQTIRTFGTPKSLPVFTIGNADRIFSDPEYSAAVIWTLLGYLTEIDRLVGTGRLYLPKTVERLFE